MQTDPLKKKFSRRLRRIFAGVTLVLAGACAAGPPHSGAPGQTGNGDDSAVPAGSNPCQEPGALVFTFENAAAPKLFGTQTKGIFNDDKSFVPDKWYAMLGRQEVLMRNPDNAAAYNKWLSQLDPYKDASIEEKAKAVDALVDHTIKYISDKTLYPDKPDPEDYWASPIESLTAYYKGEYGWGDCEDQGILKLSALRYLGVPDDKAYAVYVLILDDKGKTTAGHIMTMVDLSETSAGTPHFVILNNDVTDGGRYEEQSQRKNYLPLYALNEKGVLALPANTVPKWGLAKPVPAVCVPQEAVNGNVPPAETQQRALRR